MALAVCHIKMGIFILANFSTELHQVQLFISTQMAHIIKEKCHQIKQTIKMLSINQKDFNIKDQLSRISLMEAANKLAINILSKGHTDKEKDLKVL